MSVGFEGLLSGVALILLVCSIGNSDQEVRSTWQRERLHLEVSVLSTTCSAARRHALRIQSIHIHFAFVEVLQRADGADLGFDGLLERCLLDVEADALTAEESACSCGSLQPFEGIALLLV